MYTVHMTRLTATEARRQLFKLLDAVERGEDVVLERAGVRFRLTLDAKPGTEQAPSSPLIVEDAALLDGDWSWRTDAQGDLVFQPGGDAPGGDGS